MIIDGKETVLTPSNQGRDCVGDGEHTDKDGNVTGCCCDECNHYLV